MSVTEYTMSEIIASVYETMERTGCREGILFRDEINCVSETLAPTMLQFLQNKTFCLLYTSLYGGFFHPQRDGTMSRFLQQCLAELLSLVIGKSQGRTLSEI